MKSIEVANILRKYKPSEWGGIETYMTLLSKSLRMMDVESVFYFPKTEVLKDDPLSQEGYRLEEYHAVIPILGISQRKRERYLSLGGNIISFDLPLKLYRDKKIDLIHSHTLGRIGAASYQVARLRKIPFVVTTHGGYYTLNKDAEDLLKESSRGGLDWGKIYGFLVGSRKLIENADAIITLNREEARMFSMNHPQKKVIYIPCLFDPIPFQQDYKLQVFEKYPELKEKRIILYVGRIDPIKNQIWVLQQIPILLKKFPDLKFVFIGGATDTQYLDSFEKETKKLGVEHSVLLIKGLPPQDPLLIGFYQAAKAVILPSKMDNFGIVILEAWAAGTIALSSKTSVPSHLIEHGKTGWLFDLDDPGSFQHFLEKSLMDAELRELICHQAKEELYTHYSLKNHAQRVRDLYEQLIDEKNR